MFFYHFARKLEASENSMPGLMNKDFWHTLMVSFMTSHLESSVSRNFKTMATPRMKRSRQLCSVSFREIEDI